MKIVQIVRKLNNTELGKSGTNDTYVLIPNDLDVSDIFEPNMPIGFVDKYSGYNITVRHTVGREKRIVGLGPYYRKEGLCAGDEIIFEKMTLADKTEYTLQTRKNTDTLVIGRSKYGFAVLTPERMDTFVDAARGKAIDVDIKFLGSERLRNDSPDTTDFYDVIIDGRSLLDRYGGKDMVELKVVNDAITTSTFYGWKKYTFEVEE